MKHTDTTWRRIMGHPLSEADLATLNLALEDADGAVEQQTPRGLRVSALAVALAARKLWNCSLTQQRVHRLAAELGGDLSARRLQALRGHRTRVLLVELRPLLRTLAHAGAGRDEGSEGSDDAIRTDTVKASGPGLT